MLVGVFAGTKVDTKMGANILKNSGFSFLEFPMSTNPKEQRDMQYYSKDKLEELFIEKANLGIEKGMKKIFIYCNSLSSAIDYKKIGGKLEIEIITPLEVYKNLDSKYKNIAILAANGISAYKIDEIITSFDFVENTISIGNMAIVEKIEEGLTPEDIVEDLNLKGFLKYLEGIDAFKIDALLLACTHFPHIKEELKKSTTIEVLDPSEGMIKMLKDEK